MLNVIALFKTALKYESRRGLPFSRLTVPVSVLCRRPDPEIPIRPSGSHCATASSSRSFAGRRTPALRSRWRSDGRPNPARQGNSCPMPLVLSYNTADPAQQCVWGGADACEQPMLQYSALPFSYRRRGDHIHDPGTSRPIGLDVLRCLLSLCGRLLLSLVAPGWCGVRCASRDRLQ